MDKGCRPRLFLIDGIHQCAYEVLRQTWGVPEDEMAPQVAHRLLLGPALGVELYRHTRHEILVPRAAPLLGVAQVFGHLACRHAVGAFVVLIGGNVHFLETALFGQREQMVVGIVRLLRHRTALNATGRCLPVGERAFVERHQEGVAQRGRDACHADGQRCIVDTGHTVVGLGVERLGLHLVSGLGAVGALHTHQHDDLRVRCPDEGGECHGHLHSGALHIVTCLAAHQLPHLQHHDAVELGHAQGAIVLSAQLHGGADVRNLTVTTEVRDPFRRDLVA